MSDKNYNKYSLAVIGALTKLILDRTPLGKGQQLIQEKYRVKNNKKKVNQRTIGKFLKTPSVREVVEGKLNEGKTPEQAAAELESSTLGQDVFQSVFTPRAYLTGAQPQPQAEPEPKETKAEERDREAREAKEGVESKAEVQDEILDRDTKIITDTIIDMKEEQPTLGDAIAPSTSKIPRAALTNEERKIMAELVDQITQQRDNLITVSAMWLDVPVREVALDLALLGIGRWVRDVGLIDADDSKIIEGTSATSKAIGDLLSKLYGMSIKSLVREAEKRKRDLLEAINDESFSQEEKKILGSGIEEDIDQILAAVMRESSTDVELYERTIGRQIDRGVDKKRIRQARRRFIKAAVVQSRWNSLIKMRGAKKFEKTIAGKLVTLSSAAKSLYNKLESVSVKKIVKPVIVAAIAAVAERMGIRNIGAQPPQQRPQPPQQRPQAPQQQQLPQPPRDIPAPATAPAMAPEPPQNMLEPPRDTQQPQQLAIGPPGGVRLETGGVRREAAVLPSNVSQTKFAPNRQWKPKMIAPTSEILEPTRRQAVYNEMAFTAFDYVPEGSEGGNGNEKTNVLLAQQEIEHELRFLDWRRQLLARELTYRKQEQRYQPASRPPPLMEFENMDPAQYEVLGIDPQQPLGYMSPYKNFTDVDGLNIQIKRSELFGRVP